ncbi:PucR family transcriptional regulator [Clostridium septicum]|uniref:PucR family transcriptional regulator n=1 Tax=Clostridium septicum TaxID=1504 RepID=A0A9N7JM08_CLOSE|nr:PucR family transcriptional regulator [Clostridium septicum]AYE34848.1 PucR family transcriptional regulator [Clostridium septicum]MDU1313335.1 PucR family transcriptional regulator ligand-binding domain-containing protein [Clostridium septicum]QAS60242.1 PucR family transcriptional regulator [Clostridium septicum]UEC20502.1 PucR family transcriptional regulator ligand-binding domain-containing protein [Clostridium septicum]USS01443.1 PucR family transcriptional regulator ligand-binding dom
MTLCCKDLFQLKYFSEAKLLAGKGGLNREISLPYVRNTESISNWLYGGELLFVTYEESKKDDNDLLLLFEECINKRLSGVVILIDNKNIDNIPNKIIEMSNKEKLPLFIMPWDIKLVDIIQEIFLKIEQNREESKNAKHFLESIIFSQNNFSDDINTLAEFYNIKIRPFHCISLFKIKKLNNNCYDTGNINRTIVNSLEETLNTEIYTLLPMEYADHLLLLIFSNSNDDMKKVVQAIEAVLNITRSKYPDIEINLSFSRIRKEYSEIKASYKEAFKALSIINIYSKDSNIIRYDDLGIIRLFMELTDTKEVEQYCYENIGPILEYDNKHGMNLIGTLKCYFQNNRHLIKTSQELFIHRNTLLYRLSTIKELLQKDLDDAIINLELFNSILIYEFINLRNEKGL